MKLVASLTSPFARKVRVVLAEKRLAFELVEESAWTPTTTVPRFNPLNKVPVLVLDDGESIYDSAVITEHLDTLAEPRLIPAAAAERVRVRRDEALGDGLADAGVAIFLERKRETARQDPAWIARQADKVNAAIAAIDRAVQARASMGREALALGDVACGCALLWLELRLPEFRWRTERPALAAWIARLEARASFASTPPPA
jgi:glutathione S-transferase